MKTPQKVIDETILEIASKEGLAVYKILKGKSNVNEFAIAEKLKLTINQIRNIIYKFEQYNLVAFSRKKDRKKGWYIYFFTFNQKQVEEVAVQLKKNRLDILKKQFDREGKHEYYLCPNRCVRMPLENAMEHQFICVECGSLLQPEDKEKNITKIKIMIKDLETEIKNIQC